MNWKILPLAALLLAAPACSGGVSVDAGRPAVLPTILTRDSVGTTTAQANGPSSQARLSGNGQFDVFASLASNLVVNDANGVSDIFAHDRFVRTTVRLSLSSLGVEGNGASTQPAPSGDGAQVAFTSAATNLVGNDTNGVLDIYLRNRYNNETVRLSLVSGGGEGDGPSYTPSIDSAGDLVAFASDATNLVPGDTNGVTDVFVRNRGTQTTVRVSVDSVGGQGNGPSYTPAISADGRFVVFASDATNLVAGDTNGVTDVFLHDRATAQTFRVSLDSSGNQANGASLAPSTSSDARSVAFESLATNLVTGDTNAVSDVFVKDLATGTTVRASVDSAGLQADGASAAAFLSQDGSRVAFHSLATNLVAGDTNGVSDTFLRIFASATTRRFSVSVSGAQADGASTFPSLSFLGRTGGFTSSATNLVPNDTNGVSDVFSTPLP